MSTFESVFYKFAVPVVGCLTIAAGILARSEGVFKGTGTNQRFVKNALKSAHVCHRILLNIGCSFISVTFMKD